MSKQYYSKSRLREGNYVKYYLPEKGLPKIKDSKKYSSTID